MTEQEDNVVDSAETTTEDNEQDYESDSTEEGESTQTTEGSEQRKPETPEQKRARLERQLSQLNKKLGVKGEETGEKGSKEVDERYERLDLKTEGITSKKEQDIVIDYARYKKIDVTEALKSTTVKAELAEYRSKAAIPAPSSRTGNGSNNSAEYYASQIKNGRLRLSDVKDPAIKKQLKSMRIFG